MTPLTRSILAVRSDGAVIGMAFLVTDTVALTCAHVVNMAARTDRSADVTGLPVEVSAMFAENIEPVQASIAHWSAETNPRTAPDDVAVLQLDRPVPGTAPARLDHPYGHEYNVGVPVRAFGVTARHPDGVWHDAELRGDVASGWIQINQSSVVGHRIEGGFSGSPVWDPAREAVVGMVTAADLGAVRAAVAIPTTSLLDVLSSNDGATPVTRPSPFPGLAPYPEHMHDEFLARGADAAEVRKRLTQNRRLAILGPSGHGKSSLALAGVVPLFRQAGYDVVTLRPSAWPTVAARLPEDDSSHPTLVVVDQLEEIFDLAEESRRGLTDALFGAALPRKFQVLSTLRPDFLEPVLVDPDLRRAVAATYEIAPLDENGLRDVVDRHTGHGPAPRYESGLVDRIVADARTSAAPLPLLSHTLNELWDGAPGSILTHAAYDAEGGVSGALDRATTTWLSSLELGVEDHLPRLLTRLVRYRPPESGGWTRRGAHWANLTDPERQIVQGLTSVGLLVTFDDPAAGVRIELAHDSLFTSWRWLRNFVATESGFLRWFEDVRYSAERWAASDRRRTDLLPGRADLRVADTWEASHGDRLTAAQLDYLAGGRARFRRRRRARAAWIVSGAAALVVLLVLSTVLVVTGRAAAYQERLAESREIADQSRESGAVDPHLGIRQAIDAWHVAPTDEARDRLLDYYVEYRTATRVFPAGLGTPRRAVQSADGDVVAVATTSGRLTLHVGVLSARLRSVHLTEINWAKGLDVAADGSRVVVGRDDGTLIWFDVRPEEADLRGPLHELEEAESRTPETGESDGQGGLVSAAITADGRAIVGRFHSQLVRWDLSDGRVTHTAPSPPSIYWPTGLDAEGLRTTFVIDPPVPTEFSNSTGVSGATTIDLESGRRSTIPQGADTWSFSGDGEVIVACREHPRGIEITRYGARDGTELGRFVLAGDYYGVCLSDSLDHYGRFLTLTDIVGLADRIQLIDLESGARVAASTQIPAGWLSSDRALAAHDGRYFELGRASYGPLQQIEIQTTGEDSGDYVDRVFTGDRSQTLTIANNYTDEPPGADHRIQLQTEYTGPAIAEAEVRVKGWALQSEDGLRTDLKHERVASHEGPGRVVVRDISTLNEITTIEAAEPTERNLGRAAVTRDLTGSSGKLHAECCGLDSFRYFFDAGGNVVTASDDLVQLWDARTGVETGRFDVSRLDLREADGQYAAVVPTALPGRVAVHAPDHPQTLLVDLFAGSVVGKLATGPDAVNVQFDSTGRYVAIYRQDERLEVRTADLEEIVVDPVAVGGETEWVARFLDGERFALGTNDRIEIHDVSRESDVIPEPETYRFGQLGEVVDTIDAISPDGDHVFYRVDSGAVIDVPLEPAVWVRDLCAKTGGCSREVTGG